MAKKKHYPASRRSKQQRDISAERRAQVSKLYRQGYAQYEIAKLVGACVNTITNDMAANRAEWREARLMNMDEIVAEQLAKIDLTEREAWEAWEKSKQDAKAISRTKDSGGEGGARTTVRRERRGQYGDPRFSEIVLKCIAQRCKLLGLEPPDKSEVKIYQPPLSREELAEKLRQQLSQFQEKDA